MLDFVKIVTKKTKRGEISIIPEFSTGVSHDLMTRGQSFYAVWDESRGLWTQDELLVERVVDAEIERQYNALKAMSPELEITPLFLKNFSNKRWVEWHTYLKNLPDRWHDLDMKVTFSNTEVKKDDYISKRLDYPIKKGDHKCFDEIMNTLYLPSERSKLEWAIGAVISGDSRTIQKFIVLYGEAGTGKSTVIKIIEQLFPGYCRTFNAKDLTSSSNSFALEAFRDNPIVAFQHDGDLSRIEDNTKLNSIVSHEVMLVNEKHKSQYAMRINSFLFMGSNKPVKITEAKSGLLRRLIDVTPTGNTLPFSRYEALMGQIQFELGAIAEHCLSRYQSMGKSYYDKYKPNNMMSATNDFYNFVSDNYDFFSNEEGVSLTAAWAEYKKYAEEANFSVKYSMRVFKEELKSYFSEFNERIGGRYKVYSGFRRDKFDYILQKDKEKEESSEGCEYNIKLDQTESIFDKEFADCLAQLAKDDESPDYVWTKVRSRLKDIDTRLLHYVLVPEWLIVIDFDLKDALGNKDPVANLIAASKFPPTYTEYSKSGGGIHLHYIYDGDVLGLSRIIEPGIEVKIFKKQDGSRGYSSLRRKLTFCNNLPIATISSGLPLKKGADDVVSFEGLKNEKAIRTLIMRALAKEYHGFTAPNVDLIFKTLEDAYKNGVVYDVTDLRTDIVAFASKSHNQAAKCLEQVAKMKFKSEKEFESSDSGSESDQDYERYFAASLADESGDLTGSDILTGGEKSEEAPIVFFDVEVFPNLLVICWKFDGTPREQTVKMINPSAEEVKELLKYRLVGFNNRGYDNHILYAALNGYSNSQIYEISQGIISSENKKDGGGKQYTFRTAYNLSYTDIFDFSSDRKSLKKWEIEMGIHHQELGLPWDQPADPSLWDNIADYCVNDVIATEALFHHLKSDFEVRRLLSKMSGLSVNEPNRKHFIRILVGNEQHPKLIYTDLATGDQYERRGGYEWKNGKT